MAGPELEWQPSLLDADDEPPAPDPSFGTLERVQLDDESWVDHAPAWVTGADALFDEIVHARDWRQRTRRMFDRELLEPRMTDWWGAHSGAPLTPPALDVMRRLLSDRYAVELDTVGFNFYRGGRDSVAWHRDKIPQSIDRPVVALVSLGERRRFLLRPRGGGASRRFDLGRGDLLVTGGLAQRRWEHTVPKVAAAGPRLSLAFRHGMRADAYAKPS
jgi:alkylated DNA repair dioxygenase AlkB